LLKILWKSDIFHGDVKGNVSGCFILNTVQIAGCNGQLKCSLNTVFMDQCFKLIYMEAIMRIFDFAALALYALVGS